MKRVILCPNPYRDDELTVAKRSREILCCDCIFSIKFVRFLDN